MTGKDIIICSLIGAILLLLTMVFQLRGACVTDRDIDAKIAERLKEGH